jgi:hypothetical protein
MAKYVNKANGVLKHKLSVFRSCERLDAVHVAPSGPGANMAVGRMGGAAHIGRGTRHVSLPCRSGYL